MYDYRQCTAEQYPYTIQPGDTLNLIAYRLEVSVAGIMAANPGVDPYNLRVGQVLCIPSCPPNHTAKIIERGDTLYAIAQAYRVTIASILAANPGIDPNSLRVGQRMCIPSACAAGDSADRDVILAMQRDIDMLKAESGVQQAEEANYGTSSATTRAVLVTDAELRFDAAPVSFSGNYKGHYTAGRSYPYYADAAMGGQRGITVKDHFGVWHSFGYHVPIG
ncbi:LysM peptidoglycan-binding domain-containing protein [Paenibacillus arenilitoris]|uniref:LysM peptidoglycan-binding domain-containing protein n=1 Tax=Paenibacillus arenilitoris TaxID=2772299 RepID=A0A927CLF6_9BACL|nr:LysM peptidoglycan-binding domain-containing protein [Paenibacillus arenilitoris]MBD2869367.1 LysM peptidoglycan-binding domain-containing protein [Paenibacillus arenilitoris]